MLTQDQFATLIFASPFLAVAIAHGIGSWLFRGLS